MCLLRAFARLDLFARELPPTLPFAIPALGGEDLSVPDYYSCYYLDGAWIPHKGTDKDDWLVSLNHCPVPDTHYE